MTFLWNDFSREPPRYEYLLWRIAILGLEVFYVWDAVVTWAVRGHQEIIELNPVIAGLQQIEPVYYVSYRTGAFLLLNLLLWQVHLEAPESFESRWFKAVILAGALIYALPMVTVLRFLF